MRRNDIEKERITDDAKHMNEKIQFIQLEMSKNVNDKEKHLREEFNQKYAVLQNVKN